MNKKRGFTLVELLAVIVILSLLALLTSTAVTKLVSDAKNDLSQTQVQLIKSAADTWMADNLNKVPSEGSCAYLTLKDLKYYGLLDNNILDPKNSQQISDDLRIKITTTISAYGNPVSTTEVNPESVDGCSQIYYPVCTLVEDSTVTGLNVGAKYNCKVDPNKDPYTFYVLSTPSNEDTSVNLIMDSNVRTGGEAIKEENPTTQQKGLMEWINQNDFLEAGGNETDWSNDQNVNIYGPITPIKYLQDATKDWTNVIPQTINTFTDETGAIHDMTQTFTSNARLPYYEEILKADRNNSWLLDYLNNYGSYQTNVVSGVHGYWLLSSNSSETNTSFALYCSGTFSNFSVKNKSYYGVRPVISVSIYRISQ